MKDTLPQTIACLCLTHHHHPSNLALRLALVIVMLFTLSMRAVIPLVEIDCVRIEGTNALVTTKPIPPGVHSVILDSCNRLVDGDWRQRAVLPVDSRGSNMVFRVPRAGQNQVFFRTRSDNLTNGQIKMVVIGDSLSDTGNHFALYDTPFSPPNYLGRYSDGPVWVEYLAPQLGIRRYEWVNISIGGATTGRENSGNHSDAPGMLDEVDELLSQYPRLEPFDTNALFVIWGGANDFARWQQTGAFTNQSPDVLIHSAVDNIRLAIERLANHGARRFLVANLPDLGQIPLTQNSGNSFGAQAASIGTIGFNSNLAWMLGELEAERSHTIDIIYYDIYSLFETVRTNPEQFGYTNVVASCWPGGTNPPCVNPASYLFWDDRHPTTKTHSNIANYASAALATGGAPLPSGCVPAVADAPTVNILTSSGLFTTAPEIEVTGLVSRAMPTGAALTVNGVTVLPNADRTFAVTVKLNSDTVANPILAEIRERGQLVARDRIVVYQGPSVHKGEMVQDAVIATINSNGVAALRDEITAQLSKQGVVNLAPYIPNPLDTDSGGTFRYIVEPRQISYSCFTVDAELINGFVRLRFDLHDVLVNYHFHSWLHGVKDPGFDCDGGFYVGNFGAYLDVAVQASVGASGEVTVTPLSELQWDLVNFQHIVYRCDLDGLVEKFGFDLRQWFKNMAGDVEGRLRTALTEYLKPGTGQKLATEMERLIASIKLGEVASEALGVKVVGNVQDVSHQAGHVDVRFSAGCLQLNLDESDLSRSYAPPVGIFEHPSLDPLSGQPYDFAASVSLATLNQLLLVESSRIPRRVEISQLDIGTGNVPVTAGLLSLFFPELRAELPGTPYKLVAQFPLAPMLIGTSAETCTGVHAALDQVQVDLVRILGGQETAMLRMVLDLRGCVELGFDPLTSSLTAGLAFSPESLHNFVVLENRLCANEGDLRRILVIVMRKLGAELAGKQLSFTIPKLQGLQITPTCIVQQNGYISLFVQLTPSLGRPDLVVAEVENLQAIDPNFPFSIRVRIKNIGHATAVGGMSIGASLSVDGSYQNGNDQGIGQQFFNFPGGVLRVGESRWFTLRNLGPTPWAIKRNQTLFISVDIPSQVGGSGTCCESSERNNHVGIPIRIGRPDLVVTAIEPLTRIHQFRSFRCRIQIRNDGVGPVFLPLQIGLGLSTDCVPANGNDIPLGVFPIQFSTPLDAGESRWFTVTTLPIGGARLGEQRIIAGVDVGFVIPEENENNNTDCERVFVER